jgi:hypothetical protein
MISIPSDLNDASMNEAADFYYYKWGPNITWADTKKKKTSEKWKVLQEAPLLEEQHKQWKDGMYDNNGIALIMGKFWNNPLMDGKFLNCIDLDNKAAIEAYRTRNGKRYSLEELSQYFPIEQHADDMDRAHVYIITKDRPLRNKAPNRDKDVNVPAIEVMGKGKFVFCTPSVHKDGHKYRFVYGLKPIEEYEFFNPDEIENFINNICIEKGIPYLDRNNRSSTKIKTKTNVNEKWYEGERNSKLLHFAESKLGSLRDTPIVAIEHMVYDVNQINCVPPLPDKEVQQIWKLLKEHCKQL